MTQTQPSFVKRHRAWRLLTVAPVLAAIVFGVHQIARPVHGNDVRVDNQLLAEVRAPRKQPSPTAPTPAAANQYFSLSLPPGFVLQAANTTVPGLLRQQTILKPTAFGSWVINIALKTLPEGGLSADTAYNSRQQDAARYHFSSLQSGRETLSIANDTQSPGVVAFWPHGSYLASISVASGVDTGGQNDNQAETQVLQQLLGGWQWR